MTRTILLDLLALIALSAVAGMLATWGALLSGRL